MSTTPIFDVDTLSATSWFAASDTPGLKSFQWWWGGGNEIAVFTYLGDLPADIETIDIAGTDGPVIAHTPAAFAAYLAGRYSDPRALQALHPPRAELVTEAVGRPAQILPRRPL